MTTAKINFITPLAMNIKGSSYYVHGLWSYEIFVVVLDVSFKSGHYTDIIRERESLFSI